MPEPPIVEFVADHDPTFQAAPFHGFPQSLQPPSPDNLPTLRIKAHSKAKLEAFGRYCNAFSTAMKRHCTAYIDLFAGPGVLQKGHHSLEWGSPLLALQCPHPFNTAIFVEKDQGRWSALATRARQIAKRREHIVLINSSAETALNLMIARVPHDCTTLVLIDPFRIEFSFDALRKLVNTIKRLDVIILFAEGMDLRRNLEAAVKGDESHVKRFDATFGGRDSWYPLVKLSDRPARNAERIREKYVEHLHSLGLLTGNPLRVERNRSRLYLLLFLSRSRFAINLWNNCTRPAQMELFDLTHIGESPGATDR
jgi:three-Cys-motif partner protein